MRRSDFAAGHAFAHPRKICIETAVESHLEFDPGLFDGLQSTVNFGQAVIDGLLAENMFSGLRRANDQIGMRIRRGADQHRVDFIVRENGVRGCQHFADSISLGDILRRRKIDIRDSYRDRPGCAKRQCLGVYFADASCANDADLQCFLRQARLLLSTQPKQCSMDLRYSRFRRALSFGKPIPGKISCSTSM